MVKILDTEKRDKALVICDKLERNNYIKKFKLDEKKGEIYIWEDHWEVKTERLIELFAQKGIKAEEPCVDRTGYGLILDISKENEVSLEDCFDI